MDTLPIELAIHIFKNYLNLTDLLNTRLVSKKWKMLSEDVSVKVNELVINDVIDEFKSCWFYDYKLINYKYAIRYQQFLSLKPIFKFSASLKRLRFNCENASDLDFDQLNSLEQLEQLDLIVRCKLENSDRELKLNNLRILKLNYYNDDFFSDDIYDAWNDHENTNFKIQLKTPNLIALKCYELVSVSIEAVNSIKYLEVDFHKENKMMGIKNSLETYQCNCSPTVSENFLDSFPNLKVLSCFIDQVWIVTEVYFEILDVLKLLVIQRNEAKTNVPKIYYEGVEILEEEKLDNDDGGFEFQMKNYNLLQERLSPVTDCCYNDLVNMTAVNPLQDDFFKIYFNIKTVYTGFKIEGANHFYWFLGKLDQLVNLKLSNTSLKQSFYDKLPDICQLTLLSVKEDTLNLNYDFILKFKLLRSFETNQKFYNCSNLAIEAFKQLKYLTYFKFANQHGPISIFKSYGGLFVLNYYSTRLDEELDNLDGEIDHRNEDVSFEQMVIKLPDLVRSN